MTMAANDVQIQIIGKDMATPAFRSVNSAAASTTAQIDSLGRATSGLNSIYSSAAGFAAGIAGYNGITTAIEGTIGAVSNFKKSMEVHETGMAGILLSMTEINGRTLTWGESISLSKKIMADLNAEALRTGATTEELTGAFRGILGPALNAKMTMSEIVNLSSAGANAVKSIMPNNADSQRQIIQELRDLVAGGIQPSSSTLATALGLKDADIKAAKTSADGLYKFLMDRLKGFETSAPAYARTWQGIQDQIKEGFTLAGSQASDPVFNALKEEMAAVAEKVVVFNKETGKMQVNPEIVSTFREVSDTVMSAGREVKALAKDVSVVAVPAAQLLGWAIKLAAGNAEALTIAIGGWVALRKVNAVFSDARAVSAGAAEAQTFLGRAVADTQVKYAEQAAAAAKAAEVERQAALAVAQAQAQVAQAKRQATIAAAQAQVQTAIAGTTAETAAVAAVMGQKNVANAIAQTVIAKNQESAAAARTAEIVNAANMAARAGQYEVAQAILVTNLSIAEQSAYYATAMGERMVLATAAAKAGQFELAQSILATNIALIEQGIAGVAAGEKTAIASGGAAIAQKELAVAVGTTATAQTASGTAAAAAGARTVTATAVAGTAVRNLLGTVWALAGGWVGVAIATGYAINKLIEYQDKKNGLIDGYDPDAKVYKKQRSEFINGQERTSDYYVKDTDEFETVVDPVSGDVSYRRKQVELSRAETEKLLRHRGEWTESYNPYVDMSAITGKYPFEDDGKAAAKAAKAAERAYEEKQRLLDKMADMIAKMDGKISEETDTAFQASTSKLTAEVDNMKRELDKSKIDFAKYGIDVSGVYAKIGQYQDAMTAKIERQRSQALAGLVADTASIAAGMSGDPAAIAEAEYQKEMARIKAARENDDIFKKVAKNKDDVDARQKADANYAAQEAAALKVLTDKQRDANLQKYDMAVEHNRMLITLEGQSTTAVDAMNKRILDNKISYLRTELATVKINQQERLKLEKELSDAIEKQNDIKSKNMYDAIGVAITEIKNEQFDFANLYIGTWHDIDSSVNEHFKNILKGNEGLVSGIKGGLNDIAQSVADMMLDIAYQTYVMQPIKNWFMSFLGGIGGGISSGSSSSGGSIGGYSQKVLSSTTYDLGYTPKTFKAFASGGYNPGGLSLVGEEGPELVDFATPNRVYDANKTKIMMSGQQQKSQPIIQNFHIYANDYNSFRKNQTQMMAEAHVAASRSARRNA